MKCRVSHATRKRRAWPKRRIYVCLAVAALCLLLYAANRWLLEIGPSQFSAAVHTRSISFDLGPRLTSAGILASDARVNLTLQPPFVWTTGEAPDGTSIRTPLTLRKAALLSLDRSEGARVTIDVEDGDLLFLLKRNKGSAEQFAAIFLDRKTEVEGDEKLRQLIAAGKGLELLILPEGAGQTFEFSLSVLKGQALKPETKIPVADYGFISFQQDEESAIVGSDNWLTVFPPGRKRAVSDGLKLSRLQNTRIAELSVHPVVNRNSPGRPDRSEVDWLDVMIEGYANDIGLVLGGKKEQMALTRLSQLMPRFANLSQRSQAVGSVLSGIAGLILAYEAIKKLRSRQNAKVSGQIRETD